MPQEKQTTAVSQLKEWLLNKSFDVDSIALPYLINELGKYEEIERQHIEHTWMEAKQDKSFGDNVFDDASKFFNENFTQQQ